MYSHLIGYHSVLVDVSICEHTAHLCLDVLEGREGRDFRKGGIRERQIVAVIEVVVVGDIQRVQRGGFVNGRR